jgi:endonuclease/exonuclease/phosphatase family metal-dependent hydrolase
VAGKLGLVGGVAVAWLLTFVLMGGDVMPALSGADPQASGAVGAPKALTPVAPATGVPAAAQSAGATTDPDPSRDNASGRTSEAPAQAAAAAEELADSTPVAGQVLVDRPNPRRVTAPVLTFRLSSFNALGSSHTRKGTGRKQKASGPARASRAAQYVLDNNIDVIGFQELQGDQRSAFMGGTGGGYGLYPGNELRSMDGENSIAYRLDTWELVKADSVSIPYFGGRPRNMPVILLKNKQTGITAYFTNFHNPADTRQFGAQGRHRAAAKAREVALFADLRDDGYPVFVTGDMNEQQSWFCAVAGPGDLKAAAGGEGGRDGCSVAGGFRIDWIAGSHDVEFSNYREDKSGVVAWITDHPVMVTDVTIDGSNFPQAVLN